MTTLHGIEVKVGDQVWDFVIGWSEVTSTNYLSEYPILSEKTSYNSEGLLMAGYKAPQLFWQAFEIPAHAFKKPKVMVKKYQVLFESMGDYFTTANWCNRNFTSKKDFEDSSSMLDYFGGTNVYKFISLILESEIEEEE